MATFLGSWLFYTALLLLSATPVAVVARRKGRSDRAKRFLWTALGLGLMCGLLAVSSERSVSRCEAVGNTVCLDFGTAGMQFLLVTLYLISVVIGIVVLTRD